MADVNKSMEIVVSVKDLVSGFFDTLEGKAKLLLSPLNGFADGVFAIQDRVGQFFDQSIFKLASLGGAFAEQKSQFDLLAEAYGKNGQQLLSIIDNVAQGTLQQADQIRIASKAITSGLSEEEFAKVTTFVKKFTESTGGDFASMAESVFASFSSGRTGILRQLGLFVQEGASTADILKQIEGNLALFGEASFNTGDAIERINAKVGDFVTFIGEAINSSSSWQTAITYVADTVDDFVRKFDYKSVSLFFEGIFKAATIVYEALSSAFGDSYDYIRKVFAALGTTAGVREFFQGIGQYAAEAIDFFYRFGVNIAQAVALLPDIFYNTLNAADEFFKSLRFGSYELAETVVGTLGRAFSQIGQIFLELVAALPPELLQFTIAEDVSKAIESTRSALVSTTRELGKLKDQALESSGLGETFEIIRDTAKGMADDLNGFSSGALEKFVTKLKDGFKAFELPEATNLTQRTEEELTKAREQAVRLEGLKAEAVRQEREKQASADQQQAEKLAKSAADQENRQFEDRKKTLQDRLRDITEVIKRNTLAQGQTFLVTDTGFNRAQLEQEKASIETILNDITGSEVEARKRRADEILRQSRGLSASLQGEYGKIKGFGELVQNGGNVTLKHDLPKEQTLNVKIDGINGPAAITELVREVMRQIVVTSKRDRFPMVVSTTA